MARRWSAFKLQLTDFIEAARKTSNSSVETQSQHLFLHEERFPEAKFTSSDICLTGDLTYSISRATVTPTAMYSFYLADTF